MNQLPTITLGLEPPAAAAMLGPVSAASSKAANAWSSSVGGAAVVAQLAVDLTWLPGVHVCRRGWGLLTGGRPNRWRIARFRSGSGGLWRMRTSH